MPLRIKRQNHAYERTHPPIDVVRGPVVDEASLTKEQRQFLNRPIDEFELGIRLYNIVMNMFKGVPTIREVLQLPKERWEEAKGMGSATYFELRNLMLKHGRFFDLGVTIIPMAPERTPVLDSILVLEVKKPGSDVWEHSSIYNFDGLNHDWDALNRMADTGLVHKSLFTEGEEYRVVRFVREKK